MKKERVAIIGGGLLGLSLAYYLDKSKFHITIIEQGKELGGLASVVESQGKYIEKYYHHYFKTDQYLLDLLHDLGIESKLDWYSSSVGLYKDNRILPFNSAFDLLKLPGLSIISKLRLGIVSFYLQKTKKYKKFIPLKAYNWLIKWVGERATDYFWQPLLKSKFHQYYKKISLAWLWARLYTRAGSRESLFKPEKLGYLQGSLQTFYKTLVKKLKEDKVKILKDQSVLSVKRLKDNKFTIKTKEKKMKFDRVIATIPYQVLQSIWKGDEQLINYKKTDYLGALVVMIQSTQSLSDYYWLNILESRSPFIVFVQHTNLVLSKYYNNQHVYYLGAYLPHQHRYFKWPKKKVIDLFIDYLHQFFPLLDKEKIINTALYKDFYAQHVVTPDYEKRIPSFKTAIPGLYCLNFSQIFPFDRGVNYSIKQAKEAAQKLN